jgi:hypothetical protein
MKKVNVQTRLGAAIQERCRDLVEERMPHQIKEMLQLVDEAEARAAADRFKGRPEEKRD